MNTQAIVGGAAFLASSAALVYASSVAAIVREALRPERKTIGWALGRGLPIEPDVFGLPARETEHSFNGAHCPVFDIGEPDPSAPTAVVLHGFSRSRYDALARLKPILPHARRFLLPDLPGHGDALGRGTRLGSDEELFVESLLTTMTTGPLILIGHSLGAIVAIRAATLPTLAPRVRGVVALAPYERLATPLGARLDLRAMPRSALLLPVLSILQASGIHDRSTLEAAAQLTCPLAVIAGEFDPVTPLAEARAIAAIARTTRFSIVAHGRHDDFHTIGQREMTEALAWIDGVKTS